MDKPGILRLDPTGPDRAGLTRLDLDPNDFQSPLPEQHWHIYFEDEALGLTVGVWTTTTMQEAFGPYPGDEFMILLEGHVVMVDGDGRTKNVGENATFTVHNGTPVSWKQDGFCRKFFMTYQPSPETPVAAKGLDDGVTILTAEAPKVMAFTNQTGNMTAGRMDSKTLETAMSPSTHHQLVQVLSGQVQITQADGPAQDFASGDVFFVPAGTECAWRATAPLSVHVCRVKPSHRRPPTA